MDLLTKPGRYYFGLAIVVALVPAVIMTVLYVLGLLFVLKMAAGPGRPLFIVGFFVVLVSTISLMIGATRFARLSQASTRITLVSSLIVPCGLLLMGLHDVTLGVKSALGPRSILLIVPGFVLAALCIIELGQLRALEETP